MLETRSRRGAIDAKLVLVLLLLLAYSACSSADGGAPASSLALRVIGTASLSSTPASLRLALFAEPGWLGTQRLHLDATDSARVYSPLLEGTLRLLLRAHDATGARLGEASTQVALDPGKQVAVTMTLRAGALEDGDGDGVPDAIDNCPTLANPEQRPCTPDGGGDGAGDGAGDGMPDLGPLPDGVKPCALDGAYSIDPDSSGERNFYTFAEAFARLANCGVLAPVTFAVAAGAHAEAGGFTFPAVPGASPARAVTFRPATGTQVSLVASGSVAGQYVVRIAANAHDLVLDGFELDGAAAGNAIKANNSGLLILDPAGGQQRITLRKLYLHDLGGVNWSGISYTAALNLSVNAGRSIEDIVVEGCRFERLAPNSTSSAQAAILLYRGARSRLRISGCTFYGITRTHAILVRSELLDQFEVRNNFFALAGGAYGALAFLASPQLAGGPNYFAHNTIVVDQAGAYGVGGGLAAGQLTVRNNIFVGPVGAQAAFVTLLATSLDAPGYSCLQSATPGYVGAGDVTGEVGLQSRAADAYDLHLQPGSSCVNKAVPLAYVTDDIDGEPRGANPDIGADER